MIALVLVRCADLLETIHDGLPLPADLDDRLEHWRPYTVTVEIIATIECVLSDDLRPAIASLQRAAQATDEELLAEFEEQEKSRQGLRENPAE